MDDAGRPLGPSDMPNHGYYGAAAVPGPRAKAGQGVPSTSDLLAVMVLPWLSFTVVLYLFMLVYQGLPALVWALVAVGAMFALSFVAMGITIRRVLAFALGVLALASILVGSTVGLFLHHDYLREYSRLAEGATYREVSPVDPALSHEDAAVLEFGEGSFVDVERSVGLLDAGTTYCVAPVVGPAFTSTAQYWSCGEDCCTARGRFRCGDSLDRSAMGGLVVADEAAYNLTVSNRPALANSLCVTWSRDPAAAREAFWDAAVLIAIVASAVHFVASAGVVLSIRTTLLA